jgi:hypothetical protein
MIKLDFCNSGFAVSIVEEPGFLSFSVYQAPGAIR